MVDLPKIFSRRITLCPEMAKSCPGRGQYCAIVRHKWNEALFTRQDYHDDFPEAFRHLVSTITLYIIDCTITFLPTLQQPLVKNLKIPS